MRQLEQRHLPGPAAVGLGVEVELVHHHLADVGLGTLAQRDVGQHLGGAADDRRLGVDRGVAGQHADVLGAEDVDQREELLRDQRLDRRGVERAPPLGQRREVRAGGDQALPGAGRRGEDHVGAADQLDQRLLLRRVERQPLLADPGLEDVEQRVGVGSPVGGEAVEEWHRPVIVPDARPGSPISRRTQDSCCQSSVVCVGLARPEGERVVHADRDRAEADRLQPGEERRGIDRVVDVADVEVVQVGARQAVRGDHRPARPSGPAAPRRTPGSGAPAWARGAAS